MKKIFIYILGLVTVVSSCTKDFEEININPNSPETAFPNLLLTGIQQSTLNRMALDAFEKGNVTAQLTAKFIFTDYDRYDWNAEQTSSLWSDLYKNLRDNGALMELATELDNTGYQAISLIMEAWMFSILTDCWGDIPYKESLKGLSEGNFKPAYDNQQTIYADLLTKLDEANTLLSTSVDIVSGDIMYDGNLENWRKLANSLRLRMLLRISGADENKASQGISEIANNPDRFPVFTSNADNALMNYLADPNNWPYSNYRVGSFNEYRLSYNMEVLTNSLDDPRLFTWFRPIDNVDSTDVYLGLPNGLSDGSAESYNGGRSNLSRLSTLFYEQRDAVDAILMTYSEVQFILAEAALKGWISGDPSTYYQEGIKATFEYWDTDWSMVSWAGTDEYIAQPSVALAGDANDMGKVMTQKWMSLFFVGLEAWHEYKRTGYPDFIIAGQENLNKDRVPVKFLYPDQEQSVNTDNWKAITGGTDDINKKIWWDIE